MTKLFTKDGDDYKEIDAFTQDDVDRIVKDRLDRAEKKFADYDDLKSKAEKADTIKSEFETKLTEAQTKTTDLESKLKQAQLETEKVKIIGEFKLSEEMAEFVTGDDVDEMRRRAEKLSKGQGGSTPVVTKEEKPGEGEMSDSKAIAGKLFGNKSAD